jgi:hypothetical protein
VVDSTAQVAELKATLARGARAWDRFWFDRADPTLLGVIRICAGLLILYVHLVYTLDLQALFGEHAWFDKATSDLFEQQYPWINATMDWSDFRENLPLREPDANKLAFNRKYFEHWGLSPMMTYARGYYVWSLWSHVTDPFWMAVAHGLILGIIILFTLGLWTRVTSVLTWAGVICYIQRSPMTLFGMDTIMNVVLFYLVIGPSGATLSLDRLIARYRATRQAIRERRPAPALAAPAPSVSANLAIRLMQVHFCIIYFASGTSKLLGSSWWAGTAVWGTMANYEFCPMNLQRYYDAMLFLSQHRPLWELFMSVSVLFTLLLEISFPFLIWVRRLRWVMMCGSIGLHTGIAFFMGLSTFSLFMIVLLFSFTPPEAIEAIRERLGRGLPRFRLFYQTRDRQQARGLSLARAVDAWDQIETVEEPTAARLRLSTPTGEVLTGYPMGETLCRSLRLLRPIAWMTRLPGVASLGRSWAPAEIGDPPSHGDGLGQNEPVSSGAGGRGK